MQNQTVRPSWTKERNERGLLIVCSQCYSLAAWYGAGCTPYCARCWQREKQRQDSQKTLQDDDSAA